MTNKNEVANVNTETGEIVDNVVQVVESNEDYEIIIDEKGKYKRRAKYKDYSSIKPKTREEKMWLFNLMQGDEDSGLATPMRESVGAKIEVENIMLRKYDKVNEETGELEYGVLTYLFTPNNENVFVTSSKSVYFKIDEITKLFGTPDSDEWENVIVEVFSKKGENGTIIDIKMIG